MKKDFKKLSCGLIVAMGLTLLGGCGNSVSPDKMIDKYASMCTLGDYKGVEYEVTQTDITDEMVQSEIDDFMMQYATTNNITSGTAEFGDAVNIDFAGTIDGVAFDGGTYSGYDVTVGSGYLLFDSDLAGHEVGKTFDVETTFPEDYGNEELNGKTAVFAITINYIKETVLPDYTDAFIASNTDASTMEEYEQQVRDNLESQYAESDENYNKSAIAQVVIDNAVITEYPEQEMEKLVDNTVANVQGDADSYGYDLETYIAARYGITSEEDFRDYVSDLVEDFMTEKIVLCAVAKAEGITVSKNEISEYKSIMMENTGLSDEEEFAEVYSEEDVMYYTLADKVMDFLLENGVATATDAEAE